MKASRITAVGLVLAAGLWIASGHLIPHETAESRAAARAGDGAAKKPFRVAVAATTRPMAVTRLAFIGNSPELCRLRACRFWSGVRARNCIAPPPNGRRDERTEAGRWPGA